LNDLEFFKNGVEEEKKKGKKKKKKMHKETSP